MKIYTALLLSYLFLFTQISAQENKITKLDSDVTDLATFSGINYFHDASNNKLKLYIKDLDWDKKYSIQLEKKDGVKIDKMDVFISESLGVFENKTENKKENGFLHYTNVELKIDEGDSVPIKGSTADEKLAISLEYKPEKETPKSADARKFLQESDYYKSLRLDADNIQDGELYIFLNDTLNFILSNNLFGCFEESRIKNVTFVVVHKKDKTPKAEYISFSNAVLPLLNTLDGVANELTSEAKEDSDFKLTALASFSLAGKTNTFQVENGESKKKFTVSLCEKILVSTNVGIFYSFLKDPDDIQIRQIIRTNPDTTFNTLTANNARGKVKAAISASFYFTKQSLDDLRGWTWKPSINFGLGISENFIKDYFLGFNNQFGWGLNFSAGVNLAQVDRILDHDDFEFNEQFYGPPEVKTYKTWDADWYIGITLDARILASMLLGRKNNNYSVFQRQAVTNPID